MTSSPSDKSGYEQGFRDALLVAVASLWGESSLQGPIDYLAKLLSEKNLDLWKTLALVRVPGTPAIEHLRVRLRTPNALAIDESGRMLFLRLNGTEYDTGVTALLEQIERLKKAGDDAFFDHLP